MCLTVVILSSLTFRSVSTQIEFLFTAKGNKDISRKGGAKSLAATLERIRQEVSGRTPCKWRSQVTISLSSSACYACVAFPPARAVASVDFQCMPVSMARTYQAKTSCRLLAVVLSPSSAGCA